MRQDPISEQRDTEMAKGVGCKGSLRDKQDRRCYTQGEVMMTMRDIGKNIKQLRQQRNLTQDELAQKLFVTRQTVSNYETGKSRPDIEMITRIADCLDTDANTVLYGPPEQLARRPMVIKLCLALGMLVLLLVLYQYLEAQAKQQQAMYYEMSLQYWCVVIWKPALYFLAGWTLLQALGTFTKLTPFLKRKWVGIVVLTGVGVYVLLVLPFLFWDAWPWKVPEALITVSFYVLGVMPGQSTVRLYLMTAFLLGGLLWLFPPFKHSAE